jgi:hypothetical protein
VECGQELVMRLNRAGMIRRYGPQILWVPEAVARDLALLDEFESARAEVRPDGG